MPGSEPAKYFDMYSSKAMAKQSWIDSPGTNLMFRILDPQYTLHTASFYRDLIGKVGFGRKNNRVLLFANNLPSTRSTSRPPTPSTSCWTVVTVVTVVSVVTVVTVVTKTL